MRDKHYFIIVLSVFLLVPAIAQAHLAIIEPETLRRYGEVMTEDVPYYIPYGGEDFSFKYPYIITTEAVTFVDNSGKTVIATNLEQEVGTYSYLAKNDVDVYKFTVLPTGPAANLLRLSIMPPACEQYKHFYPVVGLIGPGLPPIAEALPFEIPEDCVGCGMVRTFPTEVPPGERPIFPQTTAEGNFLYAWFYAVNTLTDTINVRNLMPGTYYLVVWDPQGQAGDYSLVYGRYKNWSPENTRQQNLLTPLIEDFKTTRCNCQLAEGPPSM
jgi:hypothetical protein